MKFFSSVWKGLLLGAVLLCCACDKDDNDQPVAEGPYLSASQVNALITPDSLDFYVNITKLNTDSDTLNYSVTVQRITGEADSVVTQLIFTFADPTINNSLQSEVELSRYWLFKFTAPANFAGKDWDFEMRVTYDVSATPRQYQGTFRGVYPIQDWVCPSLQTYNIFTNDITVSWSLDHSNQFQAALLCDLATGLTYTADVDRQARTFTFPQGSLSAVGGDSGYLWLETDTYSYANRLLVVCNDFRLVTYNYGERAASMVKPQDSCREHE